MKSEGVADGVDPLDDGAAPGLGRLGHPPAPNMNPAGRSRVPWVGAAFSKSGRPVPRYQREDDRGDHREGGADRAQAHEGQTDKEGLPYILHPLWVMMKLQGEDAQIVAVLHDVVEDTAVSRIEKLETRHSGS
jgi:hypothetical protein